MSVTLNIPMFTEKSNLNHWLFRFERVATLNKWDDQTKLLLYVDSCFEEDLQIWFMEKDFKTYDSFRAEFIEKHTKKVNINKVVSDITNFKMYKEESILNYIKRFEMKRVAYKRETAKKKSQNQLATEASNTKAKLVDPADDLELIITETGFLKYFIKGITNKDIKRFVKSNKPTNLETLYKVLQEIYEESESEDDVLEEEEEKDGATRDQEQAKIEAKYIDGKSSRDYGINDLDAQFKNLVIMMVEEIKNGQKRNVENPKRKKVNCYNCQEEDHIAQNCKNPCKICNSSEHVHFQCPEYKSRRTVPAYAHGNTNQSASQSEAMLIEEDVLVAEKRRIDEVSSNEVGNLPSAK